MYSLNIVSAENSKSLTLSKSLTIGRHSLCGLTISFEFISRWHCALILMPPDRECDRPYFKVKDGELLGKPSINGTWVNGERVSLTRLHHQDVITFSQFSVFPRVEFWDNYATVMPEKGTDSHEFESA